MRIKSINPFLLRIILLLVIQTSIFFSPCFLFSQNVGIGTNAPAGRLQINHRSSTIHPGILLQDSTSTRTGLIRFTNASTPKYMQVWGVYENSFSAGQYLDISSDSTFIATFRGNGNFGIGVLTPVYKLDVKGVINSTSEYRLNGKTVFRWGDPLLGIYRNFSAGDSAGFSNTTGTENTFIGGAAGYMNTAGYRNCFVGSYAGFSNTTAEHNTFIGSETGYNTTGNQNTFLGALAGFVNVTGYNNTFLGMAAGNVNNSGIHNTFVGAASGALNSTGSNNVFVGQSTGHNNVQGNDNTLLGSIANCGSSNLINATAIGHRAYVTQSNSLVLGSINGVNGAIADTRVGIGTTAPTERLDVDGNIKLSGEVNHTSTGPANLLPIAYANISAAGGLNSGTASFIIAKTGPGSYTITVSGYNYTYLNFTTVVTPVGGPLIAVTNSVDGNLLVRLYNLSGTLTDGIFNLVIYKQ